MAEQEVSEDLIKGQAALLIDIFPEFHCASSVSKLVATSGYQGVKGHRRERVKGRIYKELASVSCHWVP